MQIVWTVILGVVGLIVGLIYPSNIDFGVAMPEAIAFAVPWAIFFAVIGLGVDYFTRKKDDDTKQ